MATALATQAVQAAAAATSSRRPASSARCNLRCFTAAVRGQQLVQQRGAVRAERAAVVARAAFAAPADEEEQYEEVRAMGVVGAPWWPRAGGLAAPTGGGQRRWACSFVSWP